MSALRSIRLLPSKISLRIRRMSNKPALSYSAAASRNVQTSNNTSKRPPQSSIPGRHTDQGPSDTTSCIPDPSHVPTTGAEEETVYVLTLLTDKRHHDRMTALRRNYFPKRLNKLAAHLTLFHALPGSRLESNIIPTLNDVASQTTRFEGHADRPFRLKRGMAVNISASKGGAQGKQIHQRLQDAWRPEGFLSEQDAGGCRIHYTLMDKVDDEAKVEEAFQELKREFEGDHGVVEGLALWRYDRGFWKWERKFDFAKGS